MGVGSYTGREPVPGLREIAGVRVNWKHPLEDPEDGCPASWRASVFVGSLIPYIRRRTDTGMRVPKPLFDRCEDPLIWALVDYYEGEHERAIEHRFRMEQERRERDGGPA